MVRKRVECHGKITQGVSTVLHWLSGGQKTTALRFLGRPMSPLICSFGYHEFSPRTLAVSREALIDSPLVLGFPLHFFGPAR